MSQYIDYLQNKNGETVYPVGVTSGIFLHDAGKSLSTWMRENEDKLCQIGECANIFVNPNEWILEEDNIYAYAYIYGKLPISFRNAGDKYIYDTIALETDSPLVKKCTKNANEYISRVSINDNVPLSIRLESLNGVPPFKVGIRIINLSSSIDNPYIAPQPPE